MKHPVLLLMASLVILASCSKERCTPYDISYRITFEPEKHYIDVRMHYAPSKPGKDKVAFKMPVWAPGYYLIMDYPKYLSDFEVNDASGKPVRWEKSGKPRRRKPGHGSAETLCLVVPHNNNHNLS